MEITLQIFIYYLPLFFFSVLFYLAIKKIHYRYRKDDEIKIVKNYLPVLTIGLYMLSALLVGFVDYKKWYPWMHESSFTALNFLIYSLILSLYLFPALLFRPIVQYKFPKTKVMTFFMFGMSILGWFSFIYQFPYAIKGVLFGAGNLRYLMNTEGFNILPPSPLTTISVGVSYFYLFYILFFFVAIIQKQNVFIRISLFTGSLSYIVSGLTFAARDVFIFYILGFMFVFLLLLNSLTKLQVNKIKRVTKILLLLTTTGILLISLDRSSSSDSSFSRATVGYLSQQPFVFSETVEVHKNNYPPEYFFPVFMSPFKDKNENEKYKRTEIYEWNFGTFIKEFYLTGGYLFLIIMTLLIVPFFYAKLRYSRTENLYRKIIITLFYFQFLSQGVFYFKMGSYPGNVYILLLVFFYFLTFFKYAKKNTF